MQAMQSRRASGLIDQGQDLRTLRCGEGGIAEGAGLAHDAGNLLGALTLYSELLAMPGVLHEEYHSLAGELRLLSDRSWAMINRLVNHARGGRGLSESKVVSLPEIVEGCRGVLSRVAARPIQVGFGTGAYELVSVKAEAVERILTNLVKNAAEATAEGKGIAVSVEGVLDAGRRRVVMTIQDQGCGMSTAAVGRLLWGSGLSLARGRGIGFCVVRELVAMSGGCLKVHSEVGMGTCISVEWYAAEAEVEIEVACRQQDALAC
jgi:signal transduction histidine kinase